MYKFDRLVVKLGIALTNREYENLCVFFHIRLAAFVETHGTCLKVDKVVQTANMTSWKVPGYIMMVLEAGLLL